MPKRYIKVEWADEGEFLNGKVSQMIEDACDMLMKKLVQRRITDPSISGAPTAQELEG
jgi:hypothetical protein